MRFEHAAHAGQRRQVHAEAEQSALKAVKAAEAEEIVARSKAKARLTQVEAELEAADRSAQAKIRMAEGLQAERAAEGLAEARVLEAMALAHEKEGLAKARVLEAQAPAEEKIGMTKVNVAKAENETTAEGTETRTDFESMRRLGCNQMQGWHFGKPMTAEETRRLLDRNSMKVELVDSGQRPVRPQNPPMSPEASAQSPAGAAHSSPPAR